MVRKIDTPSLVLTLSATERERYRNAVRVGLQLAREKIHSMRGVDLDALEKEDVFEHLAEQHRLESSVYTLDELLTNLI